ncbi:hypothetical protein B2I21_36205 [Chryseobacterium mucoviscidosis]|nr:hypothetical protein B2I21_36205 [Chryseobacterium mucoviscidosis]
MIYRYYKRPTTRKALQTVKRLIERGRLCPSEIISIRGNYTVGRWYRLTIRTKEQQFQFTGFAWFYSGEGPRGIQQALQWLLVPAEIVQRLTCHEYHGDMYEPNCLFIA